MSKSKKSNKLRLGDGKLRPTLVIKDKKSKSFSRKKKHKEDFFVDL